MQIARANKEEEFQTSIKTMDAEQMFLEGKLHSGKEEVWEGQVVTQKWREGWGCRKGVGVRRGGMSGATGGREQCA